MACQGVLAAALKTVEGAKLTACADVEETAARGAADRLGLDRYHLDYHEMLSSEDLDAAVVAVPHHLLKNALLAKMYRDQMRAWVSSLVEGGTPPIDAEDGVRVLSIIDAVFESARSGARISLSG